MDTKYVATFLLVAVMITRIQCDTGDDCPALAQCMANSGIMLQDLIKKTDAGTIRKLFDAVCSNIDALVNCYKPNNLKNCSSFQQVFQYQSNSDKIRDHFTKACAQINGITELYECVTKDGVTESIAQCARSVSDNNQETRTVSCSRLSEVLKCYEMPGQCSADAVSYLGSAVQEKLGIVCSAPKMVVNVLLLCMLYLLNRFLLF